MNYKNYEKCKKNGIQRIFKILSITYIIEKRKKRKEKYLYIERYLCGVGEALSLQIISSTPSFKSIDYLSKTLQQHFHKHKTQRSIDSKLQKEQLSTLSLLSIELFYVCVLFNAQFDSMRLLFFTTNGFRCFHVRFIFSLFNFYLSMFRC